MKKYYLFAALIMAAMAGCKSDSTTAPVAVNDVIVGTWLSTGADVAPGLRIAPFRVKQITAVFNANLTYTVTQLDSDNVITTYTGTVATDTSSNGTIRKITANQATPSVVTSKGIYQVFDSTSTLRRMTYEIIQTTPALAGVTPPTAQAGFGSTGYNGVVGAFGTAYVQKYSKQ